MKLDRFAYISARNLVDAIQNSTSPSLARFITSLGIRHVGGQTAIDLANHYQKLYNFEQSTEDELLQIPGIGKTVAASIVAWFADPDNQKLLENLEALGLSPHHENSSRKLSGKSYVITGTLETMGREEAAQKLRDLGATITGSVTSTTTALIAGKNPGASKTQKAAKLNLPTLTESDLLNLLKT